MSKVQEIDKNVEIWRVKKLIKPLEAARGNNDASMISLIIPAHVQISRINKMLDEAKTASHIQSLPDYQSALGVITSAQEALEYYTRFPPSKGLVLYTGTMVINDGNVEKVTVTFEPFKPINASCYECGYKFNTKALNVLLESDDEFGFIVMDENGTLFGRLSGKTSEVLHKSTVGQMEDRQSYVRKTAELATRYFINPDSSQTNVSGLILAAASADFKTELSQSDMFDPCLRPEIMKVVEVSHGGEDGFNQAIELSSAVRANVKFIRQERVLGKFLEEMSQDDMGKSVVGVYATLKSLKMGAVEILIVWENLDINRYKLKNSTTNESFYKHLNKYEDESNFKDSTGADLVVEEKMSLLEWLANEYKNFGCTLEFVTDRSSDGAHFCRSLLGIGGILRYKLDFDSPYDDGTNDETPMPQVPKKRRV